MGISVGSSNITKSGASIEIWKGQSLRIELEVVKDEEQPDGTIKEVPEDLTGAFAMFTVRKNIGDPQKLILKTSVVIAEVEIVSPETEGMVVVYILPADTANLEEGEYFFDIWIKLANDDQGPVVEVSEFVIKQPMSVVP